MSEDLSTQQGSPSLSEVLLPKSSVIVAPPAPTAAVSSANSSRRSSGTPIPIPSPPPPPPISSAALYKRHCSEELLPVGSRIKIIGEHVKEKEAYANNLGTIKGRNGNPTSRSYGYNVLLDGCKNIKHFRVWAVQGLEDDGQHADKRAKLKLKLKPPDEDDDLIEDSQGTETQASDTLAVKASPSTHLRPASSLKKKRKSTSPTSDTTTASSSPRSASPRVEAPRSASTRPPPPAREPEACTCEDVKPEEATMSQAFAQPPVRDPCEFCRTKRLRTSPTQQNTPIYDSVVRQLDPSSFDEISRLRSLVADLSAKLSSLQGVEGQLASLRGSHSDLISQNSNFKEQNKKLARELNRERKAREKGETRRKKVVMRAREIIALESHSDD